jgi:CubicO group peptidase (beta-lactamase class C family)
MGKLSLVGADPRQALFDALERAVAEHVFPGCVAAVWRAGALVYHEGHGALADHPSSIVCHEPVRRDTVYDLASLTKVLATTTLVALAVAGRRMDLADPVPSPWSAACPGATLGDLLEHCAGLAAHREYFAELGPSTAERVLDRVIATPAELVPRTRAVYSDLGFMILGAWLERAWDRSLDDAFVERVASPLFLDAGATSGLAYRRVAPGVLPAAVDERRVAPTEVYDAALWPGEPPSHVRARAPYAAIAHGEVHDDNAWSMGGVAGHAGLFGHAEAVLDLARAWLEPDRLPGVDLALRDRFWRASAVPGSTRRLGWDGPAPDGSGAAGSAVRSDAVGHTGYTGTSLWIDPHAEGGARIYVLLSNRVHPSRNNDAIRGFRPRFHALASEL